MEIKNVCRICANPLCNMDSIHTIVAFRGRSLGMCQDCYDAWLFSMSLEDYKKCRKVYEESNSC